MRVVDFHSHFFSRLFFETLAGQAPGEQGVEQRLTAVTDRAGIELPPPSVADHLARWLNELDRHNVSHLCTFSSLPEEVPAVLEAVSLAAGRLSGFALVNPLMSGCAEKLGELMSGGAFRGALFFPAMHHFDIGGKEVEETLQVLDDHDGVAFVHCGLLVVKLRDLLGMPRSYDLSFANPLSIVPAANRFRRVRFVVPHFGAGFFRESLMAGAQCENVMVDTSSSNSWIATEPAIEDLSQALRVSLDVFGAERILFGTDSSVFPAGWRHDRLEEQRAAAEAAGASAEELALIFGGNAARILGLE